MIELDFYEVGDDGILTFCYTAQCSAQSIIEFMRTQEHLSPAMRDELCHEMVMDYLMWVGNGCCIRNFPRGV